MLACEHKSACLYVRACEREREKKVNREVKSNSIHGLSSPEFQIVRGEKKSVSASSVKL